MTRAKISTPIGGDAFQRRAREACGLEAPRGKAKIAEKVVCGLVAVECAACGGTSAWPCDAKPAQRVCDWCGAKAAQHRWDAPIDRLSRGGES